MMSQVAVVPLFNVAVMTALPYSFAETRPLWLTVTQDGLLD